MKIFLTGTTGFVGRNLCDYYKDHEVFQYLRHMDVKRSLDFFKPDIIINSAAEIYNAEVMWESNVLMVLACLEYVKNNPNTKMIQIGSSAEYGPMPRPTKETDRINPVDMYQATKGSASLMCQGYARVYGLNIKVARPYSIYGRYEKPHRLFPRLWRAALLQEPMKLYHGVHDFIYIDDFVRGIDLLVGKDKEPLGDIINFGSGIQYTNLEVLELFQKIAGKEIPVEFINQMVKVYENDVWVCDTSYAREQYGFETEYTLEQGIQDFLRTADYN